MKIKNSQPAQLDLLYSWTPDTATPSTATSTIQYVDLARDLSRANRRFYEQNRNYVIRGITYIMPQQAVGGSVGYFTVSAAANNWCVQNAHVKGEALWHQMNELVLDDNPSIQGRWAGFRLRLNTDMVDAAILNPLAGDVTTPLGVGEWDYSRYVMPQHDVDPVTGFPDPAEEKQPVLIGADTATKRSMVKAYEESRATVQPVDPSVPAGMSTSFFNLLTDSGSQEPELADVIEDDNDEPPYDHDDYPQGDGNNSFPIMLATTDVNPAKLVANIGSLIVPCGVFQVSSSTFQNSNEEFQPVSFIVHVAPGNYKGTMSVPMGQ